MNHVFVASNNRIQSAERGYPLSQLMTALGKKEWLIESSMADIEGNEG